MRFASTFFPIALLLATGCSAKEFPLPMTASDFARDDSGPALVAYLGQRDATADVCDARSKGPHLGHFDEGVRDALVDGLVEGHIEPALWRKCSKAFLRSAPRESSVALMSTIAHGYKKLLTSSAFERSPELQARIAAMQTIYLGRDNGIVGSAKELDPMFSDLRKAIAEKKVGPIASRIANELLVAVDLEHGTYEGRPVDVQTIDRIQASGNEAALRVFSERLPRADHRDEARRRIIRIHIARSPYPEVRAASAAVENILMQKGINAVSLSEHAPTRAWLEVDKLPARDVLVRQKVREQTATLLGVRRDVAGVSVVPAVPLRNALLVDIPGISRPITVCARPKELDPSPCVAPTDLAAEQPAAFIDEHGALRFVDHITMRAAVELAAGGPTIPMSIRVGGKTLASASWPLTFERPEDVILSGSRPGTDGPPIRVYVDRKNPARAVVDVQAPNAEMLAVVESMDAGYFHVASRGAQGETGSSGSDGSDGSSGGQCQSGSNGGDGGPGGDGGRGGNGGNVEVHVSCGGAACNDAVALFSRTITSVAGPGGAGGNGGRGGRGGSGGSAGPDTVSTDSDGNTTTTPGCSAGSNGSSGSDGSSGSTGPAGAPGRVSLVVDR